MKVCLLSPPNQFLENPHAIPRIGLLYLGTILQDVGHDVTIHHLNSLQELSLLLCGRRRGTHRTLMEERASLSAFSDFDFIGISATTREYPDALQILNYFKRERPDTTIAIGGAHATAMPAECLRNGFDLVIRGEAETMISQFVEMKNTTPQVFNCEYVQDINAIPFPDRTLLREEWHPFMGIENDVLKVTHILLSRGCPFHCTFCGTHYRYRRRSIENIQAELKMLAHQGYKGIIICDDLPFPSGKHVEDFCSIIKPLGLSFRCNFRADSITTEIAQTLEASNCCRVQIGVESATTGILRSMNKQMDIDTTGRAILICREAGIQTKAMFMWGLPGDNYASAKAIIEWVSRYRPDSIQVSIFTPLPASPLWDEYHQKVTDYLALSFFGNKNIDVTCGVGNDCHSPQELWALREWILESCADFTHIDKGVTGEDTTNSSNHEM